MKGRSSKKQSPSDEQENVDGIAMNVNPAPDSSQKEDVPEEEEKEDDIQSPSDEQENVNRKYGDIPEKIIMKAIELNPQYAQFYLNKKGFVFTLGTPKNQMGEVVLIKAKDFK